MRAQVVIAVHTLDRPIRRAVESVLKNEHAGCVVVAHCLDPADLDLPEDPRIETVSHGTGLGFPGQAFNAGLLATTAPFVGIMGSDDWLEPGAVDQMLARLTAGRGDGILAPLRHAESHVNAVNPVTWRRRKLRAARDRLFSRTAPLGLFRRDIFDDPIFLFDDDVVSGEDQRNGALLYTAGLNILHYPSDPAYVVGADAKSRVTTTSRPLREHVKSWERLWKDERILALGRVDRCALAEKFLSVNVLGTLSTRPRAEDWIQDDFEWLSELAVYVLKLEPHSGESFVRANRRILDALVAGNLADALEARSRFSYLDWRLPQRFSGVYKRNFWLRVWFDKALSQLRGRLNGAVS